MSEFEHLADVEDLPAGTMIPVQRSNGEEICLFNLPRVDRRGRQHLYARRIPAVGRNAAGRTARSSALWHGARFDCDTGRVCRGPAEDPVAVFPVRVEGERIFVGPRAA